MVIKSLQWKIYPLAAYSEKKIETCCHLLGFLNLETSLKLACVTSKSLRNEVKRKEGLCFVFCFVLDFCVYTMTTSKELNFNHLLELLSNMRNNDGICHILDTRDSTQFYSCHILNSTNIMENQLRQRLYELPAKTANISPFILIAKTHETIIILEDCGYRSKGVNINYNTVDDTSEMWSILEENHFLVHNQKSCYIPMFHCCPLLLEYIKDIEKQLISQRIENNAILDCCDIGCGQGRDSISLALRSNSVCKWKIDCIDCNPRMLKTLQKFWINAEITDNSCLNIIRSKIRGDSKIIVYNDVDDSNSSVMFDMKCGEIIERKTNSELYFFEKQYDLILCVRFLQRTILQTKVIQNMMKMGGYFLMYTFCDLDQCQKYGHPKNANFVLKKHEPSNFFDETEFNIIVDEERTSLDGSQRTMKAFLVQKTIGKKSK